MKKVFLFILSLLPIVSLAQQNALYDLNDLKTGTYNFSSNDENCNIIFGNNSLQWTVNAQCGFNLPFKVVGNEVQIFWNPQKDCIFDPALDKSIGFVNAPKIGAEFAKVNLSGSNEIAITYYYPEFVKAYNEKYLPIFQTNLSLVQYPNKEEKEQTTVRYKNITPSQPSEDINYGTLNIISNSLFKYEYFINGKSYGILDGRGNVDIKLTPGVYDVYCIQKTGYVLTPSRYFSKISISYHGVSTFLFPH